MESKVHYATMTEALQKLKEQGFTTDFNLEEYCKAFRSGQYKPEDFEVVDVYRYEGNSDPGDESTVYAIESKKNGMKGVWLTIYGANAENDCEEFLRKIPTRGKTESLPQ